MDFAEAQVLSCRYWQLTCSLEEALEDHVASADYPIAGASDATCIVLLVALLSKKIIVIEMPAKSAANPLKFGKSCMSQS